MEIVNAMRAIKYFKVLVLKVKSKVAARKFAIFFCVVLEQFCGSMGDAGLFKSSIGDEIHG